LFISIGTVRCKKIRTLCFLEIFQDVLIVIVMRQMIYHYIA